MRRIESAAPATAWVLAAVIASAVFATVGGTAHAQTPPGDAGASMVKPPAASGTANPANPDHMPVKKPPKPTNDKMTHTPPASAANAK
ncbi:hypothetical protein [Paraburkholderia sp. DHOC27]|uniref:hypothetical protein n=1 Tax=Paraburkholderia sp. DHOC27 TaxID=2303330 RepID=UPI000E3D0F61|nr:hypothetical protein [Paraburkholderia sp. DHOC27]RFU47877.1 hypothetical protein D0B32_10090 [Paraburkholderia sp. DHOC27]